MNITFFLALLNQRLIDELTEEAGNMSTFSKDSSGAASSHVPHIASIGWGEEYLYFVPIRYELWLL